MNLQESIRRILREELSPRIRRRISYDEMEKEFLESFESAYDLTKKRRISQRFFKDEVIYSTIVHMMDSFHPIFFNTLPENEFWYDDIFNDLKEHYEERIIHMYNERRGIKESMKRILREETAPSNIRRRTKDIDTEFEKTFGRYYIGEFICERYDDANMYLRVITEAIIENLYWHTFYMEDDTSEEWARAVNFIYEYIKLKYGEEVKEYYNRVCKGNEH